MAFSLLVLGFLQLLSSQLLLKDDLSAPDSSIRFSDGAGLIELLLTNVSGKKRKLLELFHVLPA